MTHLKSFEHSAKFQNLLLRPCLHNQFPGICLNSVSTFLYHSVKIHSGEGQSQDGGVQGCRVCISSQVGHQQGASEGPQTPKGMEGIPMRLGKLWGKERERKIGGGLGLVSLRGSRGRGGISTLGRAHPYCGDQWGQEGTFRGSGDWMGTQQASPPPTQAQQTSWGHGPDPQPSQAPSSHADPGPKPPPRASSNHEGPRFEIHHPHQGIFWLFFFFFAGSCGFQGLPSQTGGWA